MNLIKYSDAAKRCSDTVNLHITAAIAQGDIDVAMGKWIAIKLEDGSSDNTLYDTKDDAIKYQSNPKLCCYIKIPPDGMTLKHAESYLRINRHPMIDTTAPEHIINPYIFPRFSNLNYAQKQILIKEGQKRAAEQNY